MPRIRTIKPEFWTDGDVVELSPYARLLFIGTWNFAICDRGHVADDPKRLKMQVLPADQVDPVALIDELLASGRLERIAAGGRTYLFIKRFTDHQKIEKRWNPRCPACDALGLNVPPASSPSLDEPPSTSPNLSEPRASLGELPESPATSDQEGKGREGIKDSSSPTADAVPDKDNREDIERLCQHLADRIEANGSKRPKVTTEWRRQCRLLLDKDGRTEEQVRRCIDWCQEDSFWMTNVLSMPTLREKYDQLRLKALEQERKAREQANPKQHLRPVGPPPEILGDIEAQTRWYEEQAKREAS